MTKDLLIGLYLAVGFIYAIHAVKRAGEGWIICFLQDQFSLLAGLGVLLGIIVFWPLALMAEIWSDGEISRQDALSAAAIEKSQAAKECELIGKRGVALTDFMPSGRLSISGTTRDGRCRKGIVRRGEKVLVVAEDGFQLIVVPDPSDSIQAREPAV